MTVHYLYDPQDNFPLIQQLQGLHRPGRGVVAVVAKPRGRRDAWLYADLLTTLGKTYLSGELQRPRATPSPTAARGSRPRTSPTSS